LADLEKRMGKSVDGIDAATMQKFINYSWPGNIRELRNVLERALILNRGPVLHADIPVGEQAGQEKLRRIDEVEMEYLLKVLRATKWRIRGHKGAAQVLGLKPTTLEARLKKLGIRRPQRDSDS